MGPKPAPLTMLQRRASGRHPPPPFGLKGYVATNGDTARLETRATGSGAALDGSGGFGDPVLVSLRFLLLTPVSLCSPLPTPVRLRGLSVLRFAGQARSLTEATKRRLACGSSLAKVAETVYCAPLTQSLGIGGSGVGAQADPALALGATSPEAARGRSPLPRATRDCPRILSRWFWWCFLPDRYSYYRGYVKWGFGNNG